MEVYFVLTMKLMRMNHLVALLTLKSKMLINVHQLIQVINLYKHHGMVKQFIKIIMEMSNILTKYSHAMILSRRFNAQLFALVEMLTVNS